jgi:hypothetical protein
MTGYPKCFATAVGLNTFKHNEACVGGQDIDPGSDDNSLSDSVLGEESEDDNSQSNAHDGQPNANESQSNTNESQSNKDLESLIDEATEGLFGTTINIEEDLQSHSIHCEHVCLWLAENTDVNHILTCWSRNFLQEQSFPLCTAL